MADRRIGENRANPERVTDKNPIRLYRRIAVSSRTQDIGSATANLFLSPLVLSFRAYSCERHLIEVTDSVGPPAR